MSKHRVKIIFILYPQGTGVEVRDISLQAMDSLAEYFARWNYSRGIFNGGDTYWKSLPNPTNDIGWEWEAGLMQSLVGEDEVEIHSYRES